MIFHHRDVKAARNSLVYVHPTLRDINRAGEALTFMVQAFTSFFKLFLLLPQLGLSSTSVFLPFPFPRFLLRLPSLEAASRHHRNSFLFLLFPFSTEQSSCLPCILPSSSLSRSPSALGLLFISPASSCLRLSLLLSSTPSSHRLLAIPHPSPFELATDLSSLASFRTLLLCYTHLEGSSLLLTFVHRPHYHPLLCYSSLHSS